jgi:hypothetical protein
LLAIEQELDHAGGKDPFTPMRGGLGFGGPHKQSAHRMATVEGIE